MNTKSTRWHQILTLTCSLTFFATLCATRFIHAETTFPPKVSLADLQRRIAAAPHSHPRLLATRDQLTNLKNTLDADPLRKDLAQAVVEEATRLRDVPPIERKLIGRRLLDKSRTCVERVVNLSMAYYLTGDRKHVERCQQEMLTAARFSDWHPEHFLDTAEMTFALAIGYDWLYDQLDPAARTEIREAIVSKGLRLQFDTEFTRWVKMTNNWGQVCHGGITCGALAVMEDEPDLAARTVESALTNVVASMKAFAPHGSYPEGPGYWSYGTTYNVMLISALESALGSDFGLTKAPGFSETGAYPALACGPSGLFFNYADGGAGRGPQPLRFWFAARYHRPDWLHDERNLWERTLAKSNPGGRSGLGRTGPLALLWIEPTDDVASHMPLNFQSEGTTPIAIHRSSWNDDEAMFLGVKAGSPSGPHGHMDIGSFVLDSDRVRWAVDLGAEDYNGIEQRGMDLWGHAQNGDRWRIFRLSSLSHNTLSIDGGLQFAAGKAPLEFVDDPERPFSIVDMSGVYKDQAQTVKRGFAMLPSNEVLIQDELTGLKPGARVRWGMVTPGAPEKLGDRDLVLKQHDKTLKLTLREPQAATWSQVETAQPPHEWDSPNPGTRMVAFEATAPESGKLTLAVVATPGSCQTPQASKLMVQPLADWTATKSAGR